MTNVPERQHTVNEIGSDSGVRTPAGDAFSGLVVRLFRLNGLVAAEGDALARPAGQTAARWQVLAMVEGAPATVAQIARTLGLARQSVQRVADLLEFGGIGPIRGEPAASAGATGRPHRSGEQGAHHDPVRPAALGERPWRQGRGARPPKGERRPGSRAGRDVQTAGSIALTVRRRRIPRGWGLASVSALGPEQGSPSVGRCRSEGRP